MSQFEHESEDQSVACNALVREIARRRNERRRRAALAISIVAAALYVAALIMLALKT